MSNKNIYKFTETPLNELSNEESFLLEDSLTGEWMRVSLDDGKVVNWVTGEVVGDLIKSKYFKMN